MKKENMVASSNLEAPVRITRSRAAILAAAGRENSSGPVYTKPERQALQGIPKRTFPSVNGNSIPVDGTLHKKRRAVLKDVTNIHSNTSCSRFSSAKNVQSKFGRTKPASSKIRIVVAKKDSKPNDALPLEGGRTIFVEKVPTERIGTLQENSVSCKLGHHFDQPHKENKEETTTLPETFDQGFGMPSKYLCLQKHGLCGGCKYAKDCHYIDIDSDHRNPQMCSCYATDIYANLRAAELLQRPRTDFMETLQQDINQSMRAILVDWLVEVAEEYQLVPDTLYLTIYVIDSYLSENYIERQRLQLLGITAMLIASYGPATKKYEEICAPSVEKFCFITDNTYTREDVLKMEVQVLNFMSFRLSVPTVKTFLRRFLRAAQASRGPPLILEYVANYLTELTLLEYGFLKFLPSIVAASAVFLARWTLDQSIHPWDSTLEHYTSYKAMDLKSTVTAMRDLQIDSKNCPLSAIREKYRQVKFKSVANLPPQELLPALFCECLVKGTIHSSGRGC